MKSLVFRTDIPKLVLAFLYRRVTKKIATFPFSPLKVIDVTEPRVEDDKYIKIKTRMAGICGTDLHILGVDIAPGTSLLASTKDKAKGPMHLGHEVVGEVVQVGGAVKDVQVGQRVVIADDVNCHVLNLPNCKFCQQGLPILCLNRNHKSEYKSNFGGWSEFFIRHESQVFPIPDSLSDEQAIQVEPLSCSLHTVLRKPPVSGDRVLVIGCGMIGLGVVAALRALRVPDIRITVIALHGFQKERALKLGADDVVNGDPYEYFSSVLLTSVLGKGGNRILADGFNIVYDCVGNAKSLSNALRWTCPRGTVVLAGMSMIPDTLDFSPVWHREVQVVGVHGYAIDDWEGVKMHTINRTISWLSSGRLSVEGLVTHRYPLSKYSEAIATAISHQTSNLSHAAKKRAIKVAFDFR